jgi:hypothetical protein
MRVSLGRTDGTQPLGALFHAQEHPSSRDERRWFHDAHEQPGSKRVREPLSAARYQSRPERVERIQAKLPDPFESVASAGQDERAIRLNCGHRESLASSERNDIADRQLLKSWKNVVGTRSIQIAEQAIEPVIAVQPATPSPYERATARCLRGTRSPRPRALLNALGWR